MDDKYNPQESIKEYIRIIFLDENNKQIVIPRNDIYSTTVDSGYEELELRKDITKIHLYQNSDYIELWHNKKFKVIKRTFMPCCPVCLYLTLKEE